MLKRIVRTVIGTALVASLGLAQAPQKKVKDQGEYDIYAAVGKETDPAKKIALLDQWTEKYPDTEFKQERNFSYIQVYLGMVSNAMKPGASADVMAAGDKAANTLIEKADTFFSADMRLSNVAEADWTKAKLESVITAHRELAASALARKDYAAAESEFKKILELNPNDAGTSYQLGTAIYSQKKTERTPEAIYEFARAATLTGPGALTDAGKKQTGEYLDRVYKGYHGDLTGLDTVKEEAAKSALPPPGFTIKSVTEISKEQIGSEEQFAKDHPDIMIWRGLKEQLTGADGDTYFKDKLKDVEVPNLKGKVVAQPSQKVLTVAMDYVDPAKAVVPEATLTFDSPLKGTVEPGTLLEFTGEVKSFTKTPFMTNMDVEKKNVKGLGDAAGPATPTKAPVHHRTPKKS